MSYGIKEFDYWNMTPAETKRECDAVAERHKSEEKQKAYFDFTQAQIIASYVGIILGSDSEQITLHQAYPAIFDEELEEEKQMDNRNKATIARFIQFASAHNKNMKRAKINE